MQGLSDKEDGYWAARRPPEARTKIIMAAPGIGTRPHSVSLCSVLAEVRCCVFGPNAHNLSVSNLDDRQTEDGLNEEFVRVFGLV